MFEGRVSVGCLVAVACQAAQLRAEGAGEEQRVRVGASRAKLLHPGGPGAASEVPGHELPPVGAAAERQAVAREVEAVEGPGARRGREHRRGPLPAPVVPEGSAARVAGGGHQETPSGALRLHELQGTGNREGKGASGGRGRREEAVGKGVKAASPTVGLGNWKCAGGGFFPLNDRGPLGVMDRMADGLE